MVAEVDICNLALSHLGDVATVTSLSPPEGSAQAQHCAVFYPIARDSLLEMHDWCFAKVQIEPAARQRGYRGWRFVYAKPAMAVRVLSVKRKDCSADGSGASVPFACEAQDDGSEVILCNEADVMVCYTALVVDASRYPPLFVLALSWHLAGMLAGPILKGDVGAAQAQRCVAMAQAYLEKAAASDANQSRMSPEPVVSWMMER